MTVIGVGPSPGGLTRIGETPVPDQHENELLEPSDTAIEIATETGATDRHASGPGVKHTWSIAVAIIVVGLIGAQLLVTQPLGQELERVRDDLSRVEQDMTELVGARDASWESSDLLRSLREQSRQLEGARDALVTIQDFRERLENESSEIEEAGGVLVKLTRLQDQLVDGDSNADHALSALHRLVQLRQLATSGAEETDLAILELTRLQSLATNLALSRRHLDQLVALRDAILTGGDDVSEARATLGELVRLQETLNTHSSDVQVARKNLVNLLTLEQTLRTRSEDIASSVEALELLTDLQRDIRGHVQSLGGMRRDLMEVVLLQSTVVRVVTMLEPLLKLANLRRLDNEELREVARSIRDRRVEQVRRKGSGQRRETRDNDRREGPAHETPAGKQTASGAALFYGKHRLGLDRVVPPPAKSIAQ